MSYATLTLNNTTITKQLALSPPDNKRLAGLCGQCDEHLRQIERHLNVEIINRGNDFQLIGEQVAVDCVSGVLKQLYAQTAHTNPLTAEQIHLFLRDTDDTLAQNTTRQPVNKHTILTPKLSIKSRGLNQADYLSHILQHDLTFGIGPAGTGKTYLAVACAVQALVNNQVGRIVLTRPAVESGERLGFLPGDVSQKVDPYLRPLYDALYDMLGLEQTAKHTENNIIEVAPLAYMRGRTLNDAFVILDEAQNTTTEQMKMLLTRLGFGTKLVVTGDITQIDLPTNQQSGLRHAVAVLQNIDSIKFTFFQTHDVIRHVLVRTIVEAYTRYDEQSAKAQRRKP